MSQKLLNILLIVAFGMVYLEWGKNQAFFLFEMEYQILSMKNSGPDALVHPAILFPFVGQWLLLFTLFQKEPGKTITAIGIVFMAILVLFIAFIGIAGLNYKIALSTAPFLGLSIIHFWLRRKNALLQKMQNHNVQQRN